MLYIQSAYVVIHFEYTTLQLCRVYVHIFRIYVFVYIIYILSSAKYLYTYSLCRIPMFLYIQNTYVLLHTNTYICIHVDQDTHKLVYVEYLYIFVYRDIYSCLFIYVCRIPIYLCIQSTCSHTYTNLLFSFPRVISSQRDKFYKVDAILFCCFLTAVLYVQDSSKQSRHWSVCDFVTAL